MEHLGHLERLATRASTIELRVDSYVMRDLLGVEDYRGPELIVLAHADRLVAITAAGRAIVELAPERMHELIELAIAAEHEPLRFGVDTAQGRPVTAYHLHVERLLPEHRFTISRQVNHCAVHALGPRWSALIAGLRDAAGAAVGAAAAMAWDFAAAFLGPIDLGPVWAAGGVVRLPTVAAFEHAGPVYLRVGQPPERSELYCHDGELVHVGDERRAVASAPLAEWHHGRRWSLPCGGGALMVGHAWQRPSRFVAHAIDPARPIYVQRG